MAENGKKALCIINPASGKSRVMHAVRDAVRQSMDREYDTAFYLTEEPGSAEQTVRETGADIDLLFCCGGDGTLNEVVSGLVRTGRQIPVCYIPCGTTNDVAKTLGIPRGIKKCLALVKEGQATPMDAGILNKELYFTYIAAFGAFTEVSYTTPQASKKRLGYFAYLLQSVRSLGKIKAHRAAVCVDGKNMEGEYIFGGIANSYSIGGAVRLAKGEVALNDGRLELLLVPKTKNRWEFLRVLFGLIVLKRINSQRVILTSFETLEMEFSEETPWTVDGEYAGNHKKAEIGVVKNAFRIYAGASATAVEAFRGID